MGIFKSMREIRKLTKQAKKLRAQQLQQGGYGSGLGGSMAQLGDLVGQANIQLGDLVATESDRGRLMSEGVDAQATIVSMGTPARGASMFNLTMDLEVRIPGRDAYRIANDYLVPNTATLGPGVTLPVKVDPNDPAKIAIDWSRADHRPAKGQVRPVEPPPPA